MAVENIEKVVSRRKPKDPSESKQGKNYLLVIAINEYQHCKPLRNTVKDAKDFIEILTTKYQFEKENLFPLFDKDATRKNILKQFKELKKLIKAENKDNLIIYFSGHGEEESNIGYWIPVEAQAGEDDEYISTSEIADRLTVIPTLHTYLIVDACFSGALFANYKNTISSKATYEKKASRWGLAASHTRELAHDGRPGENSPFAKYLLQKLKEHDGLLTIHELNAYVVKEVEANTKPKQTPIAQPLLVEGNKGGQFVFRPKVNEKEEWELAIKKNTILAFQSFKKKYPKSTYIEESDWKITLLKNTIRSFSAFRRKYNVSTYRTEALERMELLEEEEAWQTALKKNKISGFERYIDEHPGGKHIKEAEEKIKTLDTKEDFPPKQQEIPKPYVEPNIINLQSQQKIDDLIFIKGGSYEMGDVLGDGIKDASPHIVSVPDFYLAPHTVTFDEYDEYCEATNKKKPDDKEWGRGKGPVIYVSWYDALEYCNWKSKANGLPPVYMLKDENTAVKVNWQSHGYRLPTEAEWEYAARERGKKVRFGNGKDKAKANEINFIESGNKKIMTVGSYNPNSLGLYDMSGNVWEWCWDIYGEDYYTKSREAHFPKGPNIGNMRVFRGGSWLNNSNYCKVSYRNRDYHFNCDYDIGFRIARNAIK